MIPPILPPSAIYDKKKRDNTHPIVVPKKEKQEPKDEDRLVDEYA